MKYVILSLLCATGFIAGAAESLSVGPDLLNCNTVSAIESYKHISIGQGVTVKRLMIQDMWIQEKRGLPKSYTINSYLPNKDGDLVLEATEISTAIGTEIDGVELVFDFKDNMKSGKLTYVKQTPKGTVRDATSWSFTCR